MGCLRKINQRTKQLFVRFLTIICISPLTICSIDNSNNGQRKSDGRVSSLVIGVSVCTVVFVLLLVGNMHESTPKRIWTWWNNSSYICDPIWYKCYISHHFSLQNKKEDLQRSHALFNVFRKTENWLPQYLCIFGLGYFVQTTRHLVITATTYDEEKSKILRFCRLFWNILEMCFIIIQIRLFFVLKKYKIQFNILVWYGMASALSTNAATWLLNTFYWSLFLKSRNNNTNSTNISYVFNVTDTDVQKLMNIVDPFLGQMTVSFSLVSISVLLSFWGSPSSAQNALVENTERDPELRVNNECSETDALLTDEDNKPIRKCKIACVVLLGFCLANPLFELEHIITT